MSLCGESTELAKAWGRKDIKATTQVVLDQAIAAAIEGQMNRRETTLLEVILNQRGVSPSGVTQ